MKKKFVATLTIAIFLISTLAIIAPYDQVAVSPVYGQVPATFSFSLSPSPPYGCSYYGATFNATSGQQFTVQWTGKAIMPTALDVYIATQKSTQQTWYCGIGPVALDSRTSMSGSVSWTAPASGEYVVLLVNGNFNSGNAYSGTLSITAVNGTVTPTPIGYGTVYTPPSANGGVALG